MAVDFDALTSGLFDRVDALVGDAFTITPPAAAAIPCKGQVDYGEQRFDMGQSANVAQRIAVDVDSALLPGKPGTGWRVTFPPLPGRTFEPRDCEMDSSGKRWIFGVREIHG